MVNLILLLSNPWSPRSPLSHSLILLSQKPLTCVESEFQFHLPRHTQQWQLQCWTLVAQWVLHESDPEQNNTKNLDLHRFVYENIDNLFQPIHVSGIILALNNTACTRFHSMALAARILNQPITWAYKFQILRQQILSDN